MQNEKIKIADLSDVKVITKLANELWTDSDIDALSKEFSELLTDNEAFIVLKYVDALPVGFAHCQIRNEYVEGTQTNPVGYLEGIYVKPHFRKRGYAKQLLKECETWAMLKGCREFASDCQLDNIESFKFHISNGFSEANRIICFTKKLN